jgi:hypothetical protein
MKFGLSDSKFTAAREWRLALGPTTDVPERKAKARRLFVDNSHTMSEAERMLMESTEAMTMLSEVLPRVRMQGDHVAHGEQAPDWYKKAVHSSHSDDRVALTALLDYISTTTTTG